MDIIINKKGEKIKLNVNKVSKAGKGIGLIFKRKNTRILLFDFKKETKLSITSVFVFFPFLVVWLNDKNEFLECKLVKPFNISVKPSKFFKKFVEIPVNDENKKIIDFFIGEEKFK